MVLGEESVIMEHHYEGIASRRKQEAFVLQITIPKGLCKKVLEKQRAEYLCNKNLGTCNDYSDKLKELTKN